MESIVPSQQIVCRFAGMVMLPAAVGIGWVIRGREHDSLVHATRVLWSDVWHMRDFS